MEHQDGVGQDPQEHRASHGESSGRLRRLGAALLLGVYAWWVVALPSFSGLATGAVVASGAAALVWGARRPLPARPETAGPRRAAPWAVLAAVTAGWQLAAYLQHPRAEHPTLSSLTNSLLESHTARAVAFVAWLMAAVALGRR